MASNFLESIPFFLLITVAISGDPDILTDFIVSENFSNPLVDGKFFTFTGVRAVFGSNIPSTFKVSKASTVEFPALNGQSVSYAVLEFPPQGLNPPHTHPRSAELLFVVGGSLEVGFLDTKKKKTICTNAPAWQHVVFPKGLVHYQFNADGKEPAVAFSAFGSANAGTVSVPINVFTSGIDSGILAIAFKTDVATIEKIKAGLAPKNA